MEQIPEPDSSVGSSSADVDGAQTGWTAYDAGQNPVGNVSNVDRHGGRLVSGGFDARRLYVGLLAAGVLGAASYYRRRPRRRKTYPARAAIADGGHPTWWVGLVAAVLPIVYYAWRSDTASMDQRPNTRRIPALPFGRRSSRTDRESENIPSSGRPLGLSLPVALLAAAAEERLRAIGQLDEALREKERVIADLATAAEERLRVIERLKADAARSRNAPQRNS